MKKLFVSLALSVAAVAGATSAQAATFPIAIGPGTSSIDFGNSSNATGAFGDSFTFTVPAGSLEGGVFSFAISSLSDVTLSSVSLKNLTTNAVTSFLQLATGPTEQWILTGSSIPAGSYSLDVAGNWGTQSGFYAGGLNFTAAVPEPAAWAMMIGGFGLAGAALRRRNTTTKVAFA